MPLLRLGQALLGTAGMMDGMSWQDFNDAAALADDPQPAAPATTASPDIEQIATFLDVVFGYCDGLIPVRGFVDQGQGLDTRPHNIWTPADRSAPAVLATYASWAAREG